MFAKGHSRRNPGLSRISKRALVLQLTHQKEPQLIRTRTQQRDLVKITGAIQTKWTEFRPNSDHYWANGLNSDQLRKIIPEWQQCISPKLQKALIVQLYSYMLAGHSKEKVHS